MNENSLTQHFGLQMQFKVTSIDDERNTFFFILQQLFEGRF